jgi:hypothetical protein
VSRLGTLSEIDKLSATLGLDRPELAFLAEIPPQDLRRLRVSIYEHLFEQDRVVFERLAIGAIRLPPPLATKLAIALGPLIAARVALEIPQRKALEIANRVPIEFFADAAAYLDPRRLRDMIAQLDPDRLTAVGLELIRRGEFMTISRFIDFVTDEQVQAAIIETADGHDQWGLVLPMIRTMNGSNRDAVASIVAAMGPDTLARAADAALLGEHWDTLLDLATRMPDGAQEVLGTLIARMLEPFDPDLLARIAARAAALGMDHLRAASPTSESCSGVSASSAYS